MFFEPMVATPRPQRIDLDNIHQGQRTTNTNGSTKPKTKAAQSWEESRRRVFGDQQSPQASQFGG